MFLSRHMHATRMKRDQTLLDIPANMRSLLCQNALCSLMAMSLPYLPAGGALGAETEGAAVHAHGAAAQRWRRGPQRRKASGLRPRGAICGPGLELCILLRLMRLCVGGSVVRPPVRGACLCSGDSHDAVAVHCDRTR